MKNKTLLLNCILIIALTTFFLLLESFGQLAKAQAPALEWQKTMGGSGNEFLYNGGMIKLNDGNYLTCGATTSSDGDFTTNKGSYDAFIVKTSPSGDILWQKTYGGSGDEIFNSIIQNANGSLTAIGYTSSNDNDVSGNHGGFDVWIAKLNASGNIKAQHCFGGTGDDQGYGIIRGTEGSYLLAALSNSNDGDVSGNHGDYDGWVVKINLAGNIIWQKSIGGTDFDYLTILLFSNNRVYVSGGAFSTDGDASTSHGGGDQIVAKLKMGSGDVVWTQCYGGSEFDYPQAILPATDGNFKLGGTTYSPNDGDVSGNHGGGDVWIHKTSASTGAILSQQCYGTADNDEAGLAFVNTTDGGMIAAGFVASDHNDYVTYDAQARKIDGDGNEVWTKSFGGSDGDEADGVATTDDGGVLTACFTLSYDGDVTNQHGSGDIWLVKLAADGERISVLNENGLMSELKNYPNPFSTFTTISFSLAQSENVSLKIFDVEGRLIHTLAQDAMSAGTHELTWDAHDENGNTVSAGIYFLRISTAAKSETIRLSVMK